MGSVVIGYRVDRQSKLHSQANVNDGNGLGDGGLMSTARDLSNFLHCLLVEKRLLAPSTLKKMLTFTSKKADREQLINEYIVMGVKGYGLGLEQFGTPYGVKPSDTREVPRVLSQQCCTYPSKRLL